MIAELEERPPNCSRWLTSIFVSVIVGVAANLPIEAQKLVVHMMQPCLMIALIYTAYAIMQFITVGIYVLLACAVIVAVVALIYFSYEREPRRSPSSSKTSPKNKKKRQDASAAGGESEQVRSPKQTASRKGIPFSDWEDDDEDYEDDDAGDKNMFGSQTRARNAETGRLRSASFDTEDGKEENEVFEHSLTSLATLSSKKLNKQPSISSLSSKHKSNLTPFSPSSPPATFKTPKGEYRQTKRSSSNKKKSSPTNSSALTMNLSLASAYPASNKMSKLDRELYVNELHEKRMDAKKLEKQQRESEQKMAAMYGDGFATMVPHLPGGMLLQQQLQQQQQQQRDDEDDEDMSVPIRKISNSGSAKKVSLEEIKRQHEQEAFLALTGGVKDDIDAAIVKRAMDIKANKK